MALRIGSQRGRLSGRGALSLCAGLVAVSALAVEVAPADSFSLPLETPSVPVKVPPVTVKTPPVTVTVPPVTVKAPPVTVETPTVTVKAPPVTVKAPPVTVKAPAVPTSAPVKTLSTPTNVPTVPAKAPNVPAKVPSVPGGSVRAPSVTAHTPDVGASTPGLSAASGGRAPTVTAQAHDGVSVGVGTSASRSQSSATPSGETRSAAVAGTNGAGETTNGASVPLSGYGGLGAGYGQLPPTEGTHGAEARARIASRERQLKATVARERACLGTLPEEQQRLLVLRSGLGGRAPLSPRATAARLHIGATRFARLEAQALRELGEASTHGCRQVSAATTEVVSFLGTSFGTPEARGGVEAVRYESGPGVALPTAGKGDASVLGVKISPVASAGFLAALVAALATIAIIVVDSTGNGPRHAKWRRRLRRRARAWF
jgi:hypothetical protein